MSRSLCLCTGNSCRSQMAEGFAKTLAPDDVEVVSAGIEAKELHPKAIEGKVGSPSSLQMPSEPQPQRPQRKITAILCALCALCGKK